jgi:hypothetical protein
MKDHQQHIFSQRSTARQAFTCQRNQVRNTLLRRGFERSDV